MVNVVFLALIFLTISLYQDLKILKFVYFFKKTDIVGLSFLWLIFIISGTIKPIKNISNKRAVVVMYLGIYLCYLISFSNYCDAWETLSGYGEKYVEFTYFDQRMNSSDSIIFVGATQNYLFMYDMGEKQTSVFEKNKISNFKVGKGKDVKEIVDKFLEKK